MLPRYFYSHWCPRGFHGPPKKTTFPLEFCNEICTIYERAIKNHNSAKKKNNNNNDNNNDDNNNNK